MGGEVVMADFGAEKIKDGVYRGYAFGIRSKQTLNELCIDKYTLSNRTFISKYATKKTCPAHVRDFLDEKDAHAWAEHEYIANVIALT